MDQKNFAVLFTSVFFFGRKARFHRKQIKENAYFRAKYGLS